MPLHRFADSRRPESQMLEFFSPPFPKNKLLSNPDDLVRCVQLLHYFILIIIQLVFEVHRISTWSLIIPDPSIISWIFLIFHDSHAIDRGSKPYLRALYTFWTSWNSFDLTLGPALCQCSCVPSMVPTPYFSLCRATNSSNICFPYAWLEKGCHALEFGLMYCTLSKFQFS